MLRKPPPAPAGHQPFVEDRATMLDALAACWPPFDQLGIREGRDLVTRVLGLWFADTSQRDMLTFVKAWAVAEAHRTGFPVRYLPFQGT